MNSDDFPNSVREAAEWNLFCTLYTIKKNFIKNTPNPTKGKFTLKLKKVALNLPGYCLKNGLKTG